MADDRLDDAIDAVVRAVDRIERATRGAAAAQAAPAAQAAGPTAAAADAEVHELVGRIVVRTQALEEHLDAARDLRSEISELVSRLASAATKPR